MKSKIKNSSKVALITGVNGQDGSYLAKHLLEKNFRVIGTTIVRIRRRQIIYLGTMISQYPPNSQIPFGCFEHQIPIG